MLPVLIDKLKPSKESALGRALERFKDSERPTGIGLIIDATGSRADTWEHAQKTQLNLFGHLARMKRLHLRLISFGGSNVNDFGWSNNPNELGAKMASVRCRQGLTQYLQSLNTFLDDGASDLQAIILIGDMFEEDEEEANRLASICAEREIKLFCFLEGDDWFAKDVFQRLADVTNGAFARFEDGLFLNDLCEGVRILVTKGPKALEHHGNKRVARLLLPAPKNQST